MEELFFELIRVAIGTEICLTHFPTANEWGKLYEAAKKQSLLGVCMFCWSSKIARKCASSGNVKPNMDGDGSQDSAT